MGEVRHYKKWLVLIALIALAVRLPGVFGQGWPFCFYDDETGNIARSLRFGALGTLDPNWFNKPTLGYYLWFIAFGFYYAVGRLLGWFPDAQSFGVSYFEDPSTFLGIGRVVTLLFGVLTVLMTARLGRLLSGRKDVGLFSALILSVAMGHVASSQQVKLDVIAAFFTTWMMVGIVGVFNQGRRSSYLWAGFAGGLGMATKYYSAPLLAVLLYCHMFRTSEVPARRGALYLSLAFVTFFLGFFVGCPYCVLSAQWWDERMGPQLSFVMERLGISFLQILPDAPAVPPLVDVREHTTFTSVHVLLANLVSAEGVGLPIALLSCTSFVLLLLKRTARSMLLPLTCMLCVYVFAIASHQFPEPRHLNTLYPFLGVMTAFGVVPLFQGSQAQRRILFAFLGALLLLPVGGLPMGDLLALNQTRLKTDVRVRVHDWINENLPTGATIISDHDVVPLRVSVDRCQWYIDECLEQAKFYRDRAALADEGKNLQSPQQLRRLAGIHDDKRKEWQFRKGSAIRYPEHRFDVIPFEHAWMTEKLIMRRHSIGTSNPVSCRSPFGDYLLTIIIEAEQRGTGLNAQQATSRFQELLSADYQAALTKQLLLEERTTGIARTEAERKAVAITQAEELKTLLGLRAMDRPALVELWRRPTPVSHKWFVDREKSSSGNSEGGAGQEIQWLVSVKDFYDRYESPHKRANFPDWAAFYDDLKNHYRCLEFGTGNPDPRQVVRVYDLRERLPAGNHVLRMP
jgi:hypothetical protein